MHFYLYHIELVNKSTICLYGNDFDDAMSANSTYTSSRVITVKNIHPTYLLQKDENTIENVTAALRQKKVEFAIEELDMQNFYHKNYDKTLKMIRISAKQAIQQQMLESMSKLVIKEFQNPIEQFIIANKVKGPGIVELTDYEILGNDQIHVNDYKCIRFVKNAKLPVLKLATLSVEVQKEDIVSYCISISNTCSDAQQKAETENVQ